MSDLKKVDNRPKEPKFKDYEVETNIKVSVTHSIDWEAIVTKVLSLNNGVRTRRQIIQEMKNTNPYEFFILDNEANMECSTGVSK